MMDERRQYASAGSPGRPARQATKFYLRDAIHMPPEHHKDFSHFRIVLYIVI
jgi:hypothetical protein